MGLKNIQLRAERMVDADTDNQLMFDEIDKMWRMEWKLPEKLSALDWIFKTVSSDPHDAIRAGTRVLATVAPHLNISPLAPNRQSREQMDRVERSLMWHFENALRRGNSPLYDIVRYSMLYDKVAAQVIYTPWQQKALGISPNKVRKRASDRYGPFAITVRDPRNVFAEYSDWMPERVLHRHRMHAHELVDFWGKENASKVVSDIKKSKDDGTNLWYTVFDYQDFDERVVWAVEQSSNTTWAEADDTASIVLLEVENELPFLPWVVRQGGSELIPMLYSIYRTGQWDAQNVFETIVSSEVVAYGAAPRGVKTSATPELMRVDYGDPNRDISALPGENYERLRPPEIDQNFVFMSDRIKDRMAKSTVPSVIQTGEFPPGTAFATLNLATQSGVKAMNPYKRLAEDAIGDIFVHMLYWIDHTGDTLESHIINPEDATRTTEYVEITPDDYDVNHLYLDVELTPDIPTDRMSRINGAIMANQNLSYTNRRALEDVGVSQPGAEIDLWYEEQQRRMDFELEQERKRMMMQYEIEKMARQEATAEQMQMQQAQQAQQQPMPQQMAGIPQMMEAPGVNPQDFARNTGRGFEATRGSSGFNPAIGGSPPALANPEGTREQQMFMNLTGSEEGGA